MHVQTHGCACPCMLEPCIHSFTRRRRAGRFLAPASSNCGPWWRAAGAPGDFWHPRMHAARSAADFFGAALFCWPVFLAHFLKKPNAEERPMFLFGTPFPHVLSFGSRGAMFLKKCVLSCGSLLCTHTGHAQSATSTLLLLTRQQVRCDVGHTPDAERPLCRVYAGSNDCFAARPANVWSCATHNARPFIRVR